MSNKPQPLTTEDFMVPARDPGIEIFVRNKRPADMRAFGVYSVYLTDPDGHVFEFAWDYCD